MAAGSEEFRVGRVRLSIDRLVYATVVLMSVLVVYDGWQGLATFVGVAAVIIAPMLALAIAHLFADVMDAHIALGRPLALTEWLELGFDQVQVLLAALPPLVILGVGWITPMGARSTITVIVWTGLMTLVVLALVAAWRAGFRGWRLVLSGLVGGLVGLVVISLQILLKPH